MQLETYEANVVGQLNLEKKDRTDERFEGKPVQHIFVPFLESGFSAYFKELLGQKHHISFLGDPLQKRRELSTYNFASAINDALLAVGSSQIQQFSEKVTTYKHNEQQEMEAPFIPNKHRWCKLDQEDDFVVLLVETYRLESVQFSVSRGVVQIKTHQQGNNFVAVTVTTNVAVPVAVIGHERRSWALHRSPMGFYAMRAEYARGPTGTDPPLPTCPSEDYKFETMLAVGESPSFPIEYVTKQGLVKIVSHEKPFFS